MKKTSKTADMKEYQRKYRLKHKAKLYMHSKEWIKKNRPARNKYIREWMRNNPDKPCMIKLRKNYSRKGSWYIKNWVKRHPLEAQAHKILHTAVRCGFLKKEC